MSITKISHKLWEIVGLALAILFLLGILASLAGIGFGVYQYKTRHVEGVLVEPKEDQGRLKVTVEYDLPLPVEGANYFIVPVKLEKRQQDEERERLNREMSLKSSDSGSYDSGGYSYYWGPYYNLVFISKKTGEARPLLVEKGFIRRVYFPEKKYDKKGADIQPTFLLLNIAKADTNDDGLINEKDASAGFISSIDGAKLTQVTPDNAQMKGWNYDSEAQKLFVEILQDANKDKKFNWDDPQWVVSVNVLDPKMGQDLVPAEIRNKVESLLLKK